MNRVDWVTDTGGGTVATAYMGVTLALFGIGAEPPILASIAVSFVLAIVVFSWLRSTDLVEPR